MLGSIEKVGSAAGMSVTDIVCSSDHRRFTKPFTGTAHVVWLVRNGTFVHRLDGQERFFDSTSGAVTRPGQDRQIAHPVLGHDTGTEIVLPEELALRLPAGFFDIPGSLDLAHRSLLAACRRGIDEFEVADRLHALLQLIPDSAFTTLHTPRTALQHQRVISHARAALAEGGLPLGLDALARLVGYAPDHLSRVFREVTGMTLTRYRNELRVRAVLEDLYTGERSLRTLANRYGFADQAHLSRVMRRHLGEAPTTIRAHLSA